MVQCGSSWLNVNDSGMKARVHKQVGWEITESGTSPTAERGRAARCDRARLARTGEDHCPLAVPTKRPFAKLTLTHGPSCVPRLWPVSEVSWQKVLLPGTNGAVMMCDDGRILLLLCQWGE